MTQQTAIPARPRRIGIMAELVGAASLSSLVDSAVDTAENHGFSTLIVSSGRTIDEELNAWDTLARRDCEGYIIHADFLDNNQLARLISSRRHVVLVNMNAAQQGVLAAAHLISNGHRSIAMVSGTANRYSAKHRSEGFYQFVNKPESPSTEVRSIESFYTLEGGYEAMQVLMNSNPKPTGIFFHNDVLALGALQFCRENGIKVPRDVSLVGCGDLPQSAHANPPLSTVRQPLSQVGQFSTNKLVNLINGVNIDQFNAHESEWLMPTLVHRHSVRNFNDTPQTTKGRIVRLSPRERECLQWAANGKTSWEISQILGVTESTIIYHLRNASKKLNAANRLHAVAKAIKASIIDL